MIFTDKNKDNKIFVVDDKKHEKKLKIIFLVSQLLVVALMFLGLVLWGSDQSRLGFISDRNMSITLFAIAVLSMILFGIWEYRTEKRVISEAKKSMTKKEIAANTFTKEEVIQKARKDVLENAMPKTRKWANIILVIDLVLLVGSLVVAVVDYINADESLAYIITDILFSIVIFGPYPWLYWKKYYSKKA